MVENRPSLEYDTTFKGLRNEVGKNNCFLNVVIQSLWHLASFRLSFLECQVHQHSDKELILRQKMQAFQARRRESSM